MTDEATNDKQKLQRQAYSKATTRLREAHRTEFDSLLSQEAEQLGIEYRPKPTPEQKARQQMQELLESHPHLREEFSETAQPDSAQTI